MYIGSTVPVVSGTVEADSAESEMHSSTWIFSGSTLLCDVHICILAWATVPVPGTCATIVPSTRVRVLGLSCSTE